MGSRFSCDRRGHSIKTLFVLYMVGSYLNEREGDFSFGKGFVWYLLPHVITVRSAQTSQNCIDVCRKSVLIHPA